MRILVFTSLFPNREQPRHGVFVAERVRHLRRMYPDLEMLVVAPVPWFPFTHPRFGDYGALARVPMEETRDGVTVLHPRYPVIPKVGMDVAPLLMGARLLPWLARLKAERFDFDLVDAHFLYPDGIVATAAARRLDVPVVVTARGTDLNLYPKWRVQRTWLRRSLRQASAVAGVCQALVDIAVDVAGPLPEAHVLRNGVDLEAFRPEPREAARARLGVTGFTLIAVGHLIERKGQHLVIEALQALPDVSLLLVGDGPMQRELEALADTCGVRGRVRFAGAVPHKELCTWYSAADALVLASSREGWANVLLEAMACGTPVVATAVDGTPEVVQAPAAGVLIRERTPPAIAAAVAALRAAYPAHADTRAYAERFSWDATSRAQQALFSRLIAQHRARAH